MSRPQRSPGALASITGGAVNVCASVIASTVSVQKTQTAWGEDNLLLALTVLGVILSVVFGLLGRLLELSTDTILLISFPGEIFMNMLKMLILPLIVSSLVAGLAQLDPRSSSRMGTQALIYYIVTTLLAVILGILLVLLIHPGDPSIKAFTPNTSPVQGMTQRISTLDAVLDLIRDLFPENLVQACTSRTQTVYVNATEVHPNTGQQLQVTRRMIVQRDGTNILGIIVFFVVFGFVAGQMRARSDTAVRLFIELNEITMRIVFVVMWFSPFGIVSLIIGKFMSVDDLGKTATQLGLYMTTFLVGILIHVSFTLPLIYFVITRSNPCVVFRGILQAIVTALGTSSSQLTLPVTIRCLEDNLGIDPRVTRFVLPIGATVNMDGTALYQTVASIFIAQVNNISLGIGDLFVVLLTATGASIGAAAIPSAGLVTMLLVLTAVGLPTEDISMVVAVDWILDRAQTAVNVMGNAYCAGIVAHLFRAELAVPPAKQELSRRSVKVVNESATPFGGSESSSSDT